MPMLKRIDQTGVPLALARLLVGGMFIYTGVAKAMDPIAFLKEVHEYGILPTDPAYFLTTTAIVLPYLEILCGLTLLLGLWVRGSAAIFLGMLLFFTPAIFFRAWAYYQDGMASTFCGVCFDCGCGTGVVCACRKLAENAGLLALSAIAVFSNSRRFCLSNLFKRRNDPMPAGAQPAEVPVTSGD